MGSEHQLQTEIMQKVPSVSGLSLEKDRSEQFRQYKDILTMLTWRDIRVRYKQSIMGFAWAILMPVLIVGSGLIVMVAFAAFWRQRRHSNAQWCGQRDHDGERFRCLQLHRVPASMPPL